MCPMAVVTEGELLELGPQVHVDVTEFVGTARRLIEGDVPGTDTWRAIELMSQDFLPGWYDDWVVDERDRLRQLGVHALETLATRLSRAGRYGDAREAAVQAVAAEPLRESAHRTLTEVHLAEGNLGEARQLYDKWRRLLDTELGLTPSIQFDELVEPARKGTARTSAARASVPAELVASGVNAASLAP